MKRTAVTAGHVARLLGVNAATVKRWSKLFAEYLSKSANPASGITRMYTQSDLSVLAVISENHDWDSGEDQDYSDVYWALNSNLQGDRRYVELAYINTPLFQDVPDDIGQTDDVGTGAIVGGEFSPARIEVAQAYRLAADTLVEQALENRDDPILPGLFAWVWPILFCYRHCIELYLKLLTEKTHKKHSIEGLLNSLRAKYLPKKIQPWIIDLLYEWSEVDDTSTTFRYERGLTDQERWVDFYQLRVVMGILCDVLDAAVRKERVG